MHLDMPWSKSNQIMSVVKGKQNISSLIFKIPDARHYNLQLVYLLPHFWRPFICFQEGFFKKIMLLCMAVIRERFIIKRRVVIVVATDYIRPIRKLPSLHGNPNLKFLGTAKAYFVCHIASKFQISLIYAFIGCP